MINTIICRRIPKSFTLLSQIQAFSSSAAEAKLSDKLETFKTSETDPVRHTNAHVGQFYKISPEVKQQLFQHGGLPKKFEIQTNTFAETCLMVRGPTIDVLTCLRSIDLAKPCVKFVLYGKKGSGKSLSLAHIIHYGFSVGYLLVHVPWVGNWMRRFKERSNSLTKEGYIDLNLDAAQWLLHFKTQNAHLLSSNSALRLSEEIAWSKRESTPKDATFLEVIDHGINRVKYASDCVVILAKEIKRLAKEGACKVLVAVDGYNAFFYPKTRITTEKKEIVHPQKVTLTEAFTELTKTDWNNSVAVVTVDEIAIAAEDQVSYLPRQVMFFTLLSLCINVLCRYLLGKEGFEHLDPFVPILVPQYSEKELLSCVNYFKERRWIVPYEGQVEELFFLSAGNPYKLMELCKCL